jgi:ABC-type sugar transport system substrate-binding protein
MQRGAEQAAADFGVELIVQIPEEWNATVQTPMLDAMVARGDLDFLFLAPVDKEAMVACWGARSPVTLWPKRLARRARSTSKT